MEGLRGPATRQRSLIAEFRRIAKGFVRTRVICLLGLLIAAGCGDRPEQARAFYESGRQKFNQHDWVGAIAGFDRAIHVNSNLAQAYYLRGCGQYNLGEYKDGIADLNVFIRLDPRN
jgi:tetratricopeptide (TPR) repeat protein